MTILSGVKDAKYLAQFLGKKIAIKIDEEYHIFPKLYAIIADGNVAVMDGDNLVHRFLWTECENPYILLHVEHGRIVLR